MKGCSECVQEKRREHLKNRNSDTLLRKFDVKDDRDQAMLAETGSRDDLFFFLVERCEGSGVVPKDDHVLIPRKCQHVILITYTLWDDD